MKRSSIVLISLALAAVLAGAWFLFWPRVSLPQDPLASVPADAYAVVRIRVDRVLASEAWKKLVVEQGQARGIERVEVTCGFNPLARLTELVVFARPTPNGGVPRLAFAARGDLRHAELLDCVKKFTGGDASGLVQEEIEGIPAVHSKKGNSRAAFVGRDGIIGGDADSVNAAIQTVLGKAPSMASDVMLKGLFTEIEQGSDITVVARVPEEVKPLIQQLAELVGPQLQQLDQVRLFGANLTSRVNVLTGSATLVTLGPQQAASLVALGKAAVGRVLAIPLIDLTPAGNVLRSVQMEALADRATFAGAIKVETILALLSLVPKLDDMRRDLTTDTPAPTEPPKPTVEAMQPAAPDAGSKHHSRRPRPEATPP